MLRAKDIPAGMVFGRLTVIEFLGGGCFRCNCACGKVHVAVGARLRSENTRSCGCLAGEKNKARGLASPSRGMSHTPIVAVWRSIVHRCTNPKAAAWKRYGGRGITVCDRWKESVGAFIEDMGPRPSADHSVERIDNDKGYEPGNCRWATRKEQARNRPSRNVYMTCGGETKLMVEWAEQTGISLQTLHLRHKRGWSDEEAIKTPVRHGNYRRKIE